MKIVNYLFWRLYKFSKGSGKSEAAFPYFTSTLYLGCILALFMSFSFHLIPKESTRNEIAIYYTLIAILCSLPFRLIFPRNKIKNMIYTDDEQKTLKKKIYIRLAIIALLMTLRILYLKYY